MSRRIKNNKISISEIFNELNEIFDKLIPTEFKEIDYGSYIAYNFKTNSDSEYDLEFHTSFERCDTILNDSIPLSEILTEECKKGLVKCYDIAFTLTQVEDKVNPEEFEKETNKNEQLELMGRISYIIGLLIKKYNNIKLFVIGGSKRNKMIIYKTLYNNHFIKEFDLYTGKSIHHDEQSFFIIKKTN